MKTGLKRSRSTFWCLFQPLPPFVLKCSATISLTRGDHADIKMTKTRRQAGDSGAAPDMRGGQESGDELETFKKKKEKKVKL